MEPDQDSTCNPSPIQIEVETAVTEEREEDDSEGDHEFDLEILENGKKFRTSFHVNKIFYPKINGEDSQTRKGIEKLTNTEIITGDENIEIIGSSKKNVVECRKKIEKIVRKGKHKSGLTHFLSIPFNIPSFQASFEKFKDEILNDEEIEIDPYIFQNPQKLHQTILPMILSDKIDHKKAIEYLNQCKEEIVDPFFSADPNKKLEMKLAGIGVMNPDPKKANVLFAKIESEEFQTLCNQIMEFYVRKMLVAKEFDRVKLHVTLMNTVFIMRKKPRGPNEPKKKRKRQDLIFDATKILEKYGNYDFGTFQLEEIHLSSLSKIREDGFYEPSTVIKV